MASENHSQGSSDGGADQDDNHDPAGCVEERPAVAARAGPDAEVEDYEGEFGAEDGHYVEGLAGVEPLRGKCQSNSCC